MNRKIKNQLGEGTRRFDYGSFSLSAAERAQQAAERVRQTPRENLQDVLAVGAELLSAKQCLGYGAFGEWLAGETGLSLRTAQLWMAVAKRFGSKSATVAHLKIQLRAAYFLAGRSVPEEAVRAAIQRAEQGGEITEAIAREIVRQLRGETREWASARARQEAMSERELRCYLYRHREAWGPGRWPLLANVLREFADSLEPL